MLTSVHSATSVSGLVALVLLVAGTAAVDSG